MKKKARAKNPPRSKGGRPTKFDQTLVARAVELVRHGVPEVFAASAAAVAPNTWRDWLRQGADGFSPEKVAFRAEVLAARLQSVSVRVQRIARAGAGILEMGPEKDAQGKPTGRMVPIPGKWAVEPDWHADAWYLERRYPEMFARRDRITMELTDKARKLAAVTGIDSDELLAEAEKMVALADRTESDGDLGTGDDGGDGQAN